MHVFSILTALSFGREKGGGVVMEFSFVFLMDGQTI